jgi:hypothetical protein
MRLGGGLGGDSRAAKEPRKKLLADAAARGTTLPAAEAPIRYSGQRSVSSSASQVATVVRRQCSCSADAEGLCVLQLLTCTAWLRNSVSVLVG